MEPSKEFFTPSSTPSAAAIAGMVWIMTSVVCQQFNLLEPMPRFVGLGFSFLLGLLVLTSEGLSLFKRGVYYVINSVVIFTIAMGANGVVVPKDPAAASAKAVASQIVRVPALSDLFMASAIADDRGWCCIGAALTASSAAQCAQRSGRYFGSEADAKGSCKPFPAQAAPRNPGFLRPW